MTEKFSQNNSNTELRYHIFGETDNILQNNSNSLLNNLSNEQSINNFIYKISGN